MTQQIVLNAVDTVLKEHSSRLGVPESEGRSIHLWHLLASLLQYCDEHRIDFDLEVEVAREYLRAFGSE